MLYITSNIYNFFFLIFNVIICLYTDNFAKNIEKHAKF